MAQLRAHGGFVVAPLRREGMKARVCMIGDNSVGKTSLIGGYVFDD
jgi:GTPase SAR1 family protein